MHWELGYWEELHLSARIADEHLRVCPQHITHPHVNLNSSRRKDPNYWQGRCGRKSSHYWRNNLKTVEWKWVLWLEKQFEGSFDKCGRIASWIWVHHAITAFLYSNFGRSFWSSSSKTLAQFPAQAFRVRWDAYYWQKERDVGISGHFRFGLPFQELQRDGSLGRNRRNDQLFWKISPLYQPRIRGLERGLCLFGRDTLPR